jgi:hypothetical protein
MARVFASVPFQDFGQLARPGADDHVRFIVAKQNHAVESVFDVTRFQFHQLSIVSRAWKTVIAPDEAAHAPGLRCPELSPVIGHRLACPQRIDRSRHCLSTG